MGNCPSSGLKELLEEVTSNECKQEDAAPLSSDTPDRMTLIDPRSPLVDAERTPIEVLFKSNALTHVSETDELPTDESHHHRRQLDDPRSATAGIQRTPILVESPQELNSDSTGGPVEDPADVEDGQEFPKPANTDTPVLVCDMPQKVIAVAKKLTFDVSPSPRKVKTADVISTSRCRTPLAHVQGITSNGSRGNCHGRRLSAKVKPQRPMSPLQLLQVRQRLAVKRVLQLTQARTETEVENCPPTDIEGIRCEPAVQPVKVSAPPALTTKDPSLRF